MTDADVIDFVHVALFRAPRTAALDGAGLDALARSLWAALERSPWADSAPQPFGRADEAWLASSQLEQFIASNEQTLANDLAMYVGLGGPPAAATSVVGRGAKTTAAAASRRR